MGDGYYLGESKYSGWTVSKERIYDREKFIERFALVAGKEANIWKVQAATNDTPKVVTGDFIIVDYSEKAIAVFGDTKPVTSGYLYY
jgi:ribonuclease BN (tRNA processing enzyme)